MTILRGTRYSLPPGDRPSARLDPGDIVEITLSGFWKGWQCVGHRKVACLFFKPTGENNLPWIYCSKSAFVDIVRDLDQAGLAIDTPIFLRYQGNLHWVRGVELDLLLASGVIPVATATA